MVEGLPWKETLRSDIDINLESEKTAEQRHISVTGCTGKKQHNDDNTQAGRSQCTWDDKQDA